MIFEDVPEVVRRRMSRIRKTGSKPEVLVRRVAHRLGYRFRINRRDLPGTPDIVFPRRRKIIFVHGCFWHQHPGCRHSTTPKVRAGYWAPKLHRTVERDSRTKATLEDLGWSVRVAWECELRDEALIAAMLDEFLS
jgi:DNA mismatch endonuclease Vsr